MGSVALTEAELEEIVQAIALLFNFTSRKKDELAADRPLSGVDFDHTTKQVQHDRALVCLVKKRK
jgi:hypothetical protein